MAITRIGSNQLINLASNITGTLPTGNGGSGRTAVTGNVLQVVTNTHATRFTTSSTSFVAATGYTIAITPSATSSKIFVMVSSMMDTGASSRTIYATFYRDGSDIIGDAEGIGVSYSGGARIYTPVTISTLDSPSTTSAVTYQVYVRAGGGAVVFNDSEGKAQLTAFEIAG